MKLRKLFENEQELERLFILYGNTTDCYYNGLEQPFLSFEPLLESHLDSLGYKRIIFYSGKSILRCYQRKHADTLEELINPPGKQEEERRAPVTSRVSFNAPMFARKAPAMKAQDAGAGFTFSDSQDKMYELLDAAMRDKTVKTCVIFTHCWNLLDMQTSGETKEKLADTISGWYNLSTNNHNIALFLFGEPRLESLASFLRNKSAWAFLYERMFSNDLPTEAVIRIGGPQRDEIFLQMSVFIGASLYNAEVEKAALTLVQKQGNKLLSLRRYLEHVSAKLEPPLAPGSPPTVDQRKAIVDRLLKDYGDKDAINAAEKIAQTEGWEEISRMVNRLIDEAKALPKTEDNLQELLQKLGGSCLRLTVRDEQAGPGINMTIMLKGNPGTGKTTAAYWIGEAFRQNGLLPVGRVITAAKDQLEAGYVGQSAIKTREKINEAIGNVLFIDEAYSLFRSEDEGRASFGREVIDTLVQAMTAHRGELAFILAGYPEEMDYFLTANSGLSRRFGDNIVTIADYDAGMLERIALDDLIRDSGEGVSDSVHEEPHVPEKRRRYLLDGDLIYSEREREMQDSLPPQTPEEVKEKTRQDRAEERDLCPFSIYFDNWFADRDREKFGNAGAALQLADRLRQSARQRADARGAAPDAPVLITREDFPQGTDHLFECRKPSVAEIRKQMEDVIGMVQVRKTLERITAYMQLAVLQQDMLPGEGRRGVEPGHYLFVGNPGTGKTMISEKLALALSGLGVIQRYRPIRVTGLELANMLTSHQGVNKLTDFVNSCVGGVLVIDEAHQLAQTNLGPLAIKTLLDPMVEKKNEMSFVFCCYPENEQELLELEPGLARRISDIIRFEDYTPEDILAILRLKARREEYQMDDAVAKQALDAIRQLTSIENQNGGTAEKLFKAMKIALSERLMANHTDIRQLKSAAENDPGLLTRFEPGDAEQALAQLMELYRQAPYTMRKGQDDEAAEKV